MSTILLPEALSPSERYQREIDALLRQVNRLEAQSVRRALELLTQARRRIIARFAEIPDDSGLAAYLQRMQRAVEETMGRYVTQYADLLDVQTAQAFTFGAALVDEPLLAAGVQLTAQLPSLSPAFTDVLQGYRASLITNISQQAMTSITTEIQLGVLSGASIWDMQQAVARILRTQPDPGGVYRGIAARAEVITRTELNRTFNLATTARQEQLAERSQQTLGFTPKKRWLNAGDARVRPSHAAASLLEQRPPMDGDFVVGGHKAKGPHDPRLPPEESINCRCRSILAPEALNDLLGAA